VTEYEHCDEPWGPITGREFLDWLRSYELLKKNSAAWR
jgi:hypothetical protein